MISEEKREEIIAILKEWGMSPLAHPLPKVADQILSLIFADDQTVELLSEEEIYMAVTTGFAKKVKAKSLTEEIEKKRHEAVKEAVKAQASKMIEDGWRKVRKC